MIDIHCHILPGLDDGPQLMTMAIQMALKAERSGIDTVIGTPHFIESMYPISIALVERTVNHFRAELARRKIKLKIFAGGEIRMVHNTSCLLEQGRLPSLAGSDYYLFELPDIFIKEGIIKVLRQLKEKKAIPVIAHPELNRTLIKNPSIITDLIKEKALFQLTGQSVLQQNGKVCFKIAQQMIKDGHAHFIASDGHDMQFRKPCLTHVFNAVKHISIERTAQKILIENPGRIISGISKNLKTIKRVG